MYKSLLVVFLIIIFLSFVFFTTVMSEENDQMNPVITFNPKSIDDVLYNPFMGMAPPAINGPYPNPHRLVYAVVTWRELEPQQGEFAFDGIETKYKLDYWDEQGVKLILRLVMDYSDDQGGMDIPDWLYEELDGDGIWYDESPGKGFSPNYENPKLIAHHKRLLEAMGARYNNDSKIAFIALGSLGHWGEWHTYMDQRLEIPFPHLPISDQYVDHYLAFFPNKHLLMRRPHPIAKDKQIGLYNDMFGSYAGTVESFLDWIENGYTSKLANSEMPEMPEFWLKTPSGGEFAYAHQVRNYFTNEGIEEIIAQAQSSHTSWLGPSNPIGLHLSDEENNNLNRFLNTIGYRFAVQSVSYRLDAKAGSHHTLSFMIENKGIAPFYYRWPIEIALINEDEEIVMKSLMDEDIRRWIPGLIQTNQNIEIPGSLPKGTYTLTIAILDGLTLQPGIDFAMEGRRNDGRFSIGSLNINK